MVDDDQCVHVQVLNASQAHITLCKGTPLGNLFYCAMC